MCWLEEYERSGSEEKKKTACVIGASGYIGSLLCKLLLQRGYVVRATVRDKGNHEKTSHLQELKREFGEDAVEIFEADLTLEGSFDEAIAGSYFVFHLATPVDFHSLDPQRDMVEPAVKGTVNVLKSCAKTRTVKRVVWTSSAAAVCFSKPREEEGELVMDENNWTDTDLLASEKPLTWGYAVSKTLAEKAGMRFAEENGIELVTIAPSLLTGPSLTHGIPNSVALATALITGEEGEVKTLESMGSLYGSVSVTHVEDAAEAHIFLAEEDDASGRYICNGFDVSMADLSLLLAQRYPLYNVVTTTCSKHVFSNDDKKGNPRLSSKKLIDQGFIFKYNIEETYDQSVKYLEAKGVLNP